MDNKTKLETFKYAGMIKWDGGEMPVPKGTLIRVRKRDEIEYVCIAGDYISVSWAHNGVLSDIMAYQVLELGTTVEGDPIVIGAEYECRDGNTRVIAGESNNPEYPILTTNAESITTNGRFDIGEEDEEDLMRLYRPDTEEINTLSEAQVKLILAALHEDANNLSEAQVKFILAALHVAGHVSEYTLKRLIELL